MMGVVIAEGPHKNQETCLACYQRALQQLSVQPKPNFSLVTKVCHLFGLLLHQLCKLRWIKMIGP
jgi:hypothetical protein